MILPVWKYKLTHSQGIKRHGVHVSMFGVANIIQSRKSFLWCRNGQMTTRSDALAWSLVSWVKMCPTSLHFKSVMQIYVRSNCKYNSLLVQIRNCAIVCVRPAARCGCSCDDHYLSPFIRRSTVSRDRGISPRLYQIVLVCAILEDCATSTMCYCVEF